MISSRFLRRYYYELDKLPAKCAVNYLWCNSADDLRTNIFCVDAKGTGAGGAFITVKDAANFWKGLLDGKLLSKDMVENMLKKHSGEGDDPEEGSQNALLHVKFTPRLNNTGEWKNCTDFAIIKLAK